MTKKAVKHLEKKITAIPKSCNHCSKDILRLPANLCGISKEVNDKQQHDGKMSR